MSGNNVNLPWEARYRDETHRLQLPNHCEVGVVDSTAGPTFTLRGIQSTIAVEPIDGPPPAAELAVDNASARIVVGDMSRPIRDVRFVDGLPKMPSGKTRKNELRNVDDSVPA
jgi:acyl-coenzyme A synthetase/AMP-(fatty) acid ligase